MGVPEPAVRVYAESEIRSHLVFQLSKILALCLRAVREQAALPQWEVIVPGDAAGRLLALPSLENLPPCAEPVIALINRLQGDEEIPEGVSGIVVTHETPYLSHFAVRAREAGVVFVACEDTEQASILKPFVGQSAILKASPGEVTVTSASDPNLHPVNSPKPHHRPPPSEMPKLEPFGLSFLIPLERVSIGNGGRKAYGAKLLEELSLRDGAGFETPRGVVIPFGVMDAALHAQPSLEGEYLRCLGRLNDLTSDEFRDNLQRLQSLVRQLEMPPSLVSEVVRQFGPDARLMVRSSATCEDLAGLTAAGLYESFANVDPGRIGEAVREVWASLWTPRATLNRKSNGFSHDRTFMAVLIQQLISPDLSFIMHTRNPLSENPDELLVELVVGLGQTLASAEQPGTPYRLVFNKVTGDIHMHSFSNFSEAVFPAAKAGTVTEKLDYSKIKFSTNASHRASMGKRLGSIGGLVEVAFGGPQDVEGVIAGEVIFLVQSRPQQL